MSGYLGGPDRRDSTVNRRDEPSNTDIFTAVTANAGIVGTLSGKLDDLKEDVGELKQMSKSYVTHDALQLQLQASTSAQAALASNLALGPAAAAAKAEQTLADIAPKVMTLWGERFFVKGALYVILGGGGIGTALGVAAVIHRFFP